MSLRATTNMGLITSQTQRIAAMLNGDSKAMAPVLQAVGQMVAGWHVKYFAEKGKRFGGWPRINPVFALLRRRGKGPKVRDWKDAVRLAYNANPLSDTGRLKISLQAGGANAVLKVGRLEVTVGTNLKYSSKHQLGGGDFFRFGEAEHKIFDRNVAKTLPGKRASGSGAKKNWNPFYFAMRNYFMKKRGSAYRVRKRQFIITTLDSREQRLIGAEVTRQLDILSTRRSRQP